MEQQIDCMVAGHTCVDLFPRFETAAKNFADVFKPGKLVHVGQMSHAVGGVVPNVAGALIKLGLKVNVIGKLGDDAYGQIVQKEMIRSGLNTESMVVEKSTGTSYSIVLNIPGIDRIPLHYPGANDSFGMDDLDFKIIQKARHFHFGYPPLMKRFYADDGIQLANIFKEVRSRGLTTSLDMARPDPDSPAGKANWKKILTKTLPYVDLFTPSIEEILYMIDRKSFKKFFESPSSSVRIKYEDLVLLGEKLLDMGTKEALIKLGEYGAYYTGENKSIYSPCFKVNVKGTIGAGDCSIAGFLAARLKGFDVESCLEVALATGACNVEEIDSLSGIPSWDKLIYRINHGWPKRPSIFKQKNYE